MSYNLYVTRRKHWFDDTPKLQISQANFIKFVTDHPHLKLEESKDPTYVSAIFQAQSASEGCTEWTIAWEDGTVRADMRMVPREVAQVLLEFATFADATLQGEDAEVYTAKDISSFKTVAELEAMDREQAERMEKARTDALRKKKRIFALRMLWRVVLVILLMGSIIGWLLIPVLFSFWRKESKALRG